MNDVAIQILDEEKDKLEYRVISVKRKIDLIKKFKTDYPNVDIEGAKCFLSWIEHSCLCYDDIIRKMRDEK